MNPAPLPERIDGPRISLRKHSLDTTEQMFRAVDQDRARLGRFLPWVDGVRTLLEEAAYIKLTHVRWANHELFDYSIFIRPETSGEPDRGTFAGNIGVHNIAWGDERCELGYWIAGPFEGQGLVSEAVATLEPVLFGAGFNRIEICCSSANERSASVPRRLGYHLDGIMRQDAREADGFRDTLVFSKLRSDRP